MEGKLGGFNGPLKGKKLSELISAHPEAILGEKSLARFGENFPLLIKFIDAKEPLSVQVHPNNDLAQERHNSWGKSEMWYVIDASPEAALTLGFNQTINSTDFQQRCKDNDLTTILQEQKVRKGDVVDARRLASRHWRRHSGRNTAGVGYHLPCL